MTEQASRLATHALRLMLLLAGFVLIADLLEVSDVISPRTEGGVRFLCVTCFCVLIVAKFRTPLISPPVRRAVAGTLVLLALITFMEWTGEFRSLDHVILLGAETRSHHYLLRALLVAFGLAPFVLIVIALRADARSRLELNGRIAERTRALLDSNSRLQGEIRNRTRIENQLSRALADMESLVGRESTSISDVQRRVIHHERLSALGQMAAGVAHQLNNKVTPIISHAELMRASSQLSADLVDHVDAMLASAREAAQIVSSLSKFEEEKNSDYRAQVTASDLFREVKEFTRPCWQDEASRSGKHVELSTDADDLTVSLHPVQMRQVLSNLVLNSVDAIGNSGKIRLTAESNAGWVLFRVADNGCGMTDDEARRCFEPFFTTKSAGTGLGLSVCYGIVKAHGGRIDVRSSPEGTTFDISIPHGVSSAHTLDDQRLRLANFNFLLVEDNERVRIALTRVLASFGAKVTAVDSANRALDATTDQRFDLILTDLSMPEMDGCQLIQALREKHVATPTVLMSGWPTAKVSQRFDDSNRPDAVLKKPASLEQVQQVVYDLLLDSPQDG